MFPSLFQPFEQEKHLTQSWQFLQKGVCAQILPGRLVMNVQTMFFCIPCVCLSVCLSVIQYEENNFWVCFLELNVLVQRLNHMEMQSHNLAG